MHILFVQIYKILMISQTLEHMQTIQFKSFSDEATVRMRKEYMLYIHILNIHIHMSIS